MEGTTAAGGEPALPAQGTSIEDELLMVHEGLLAEREHKMFELPGFRSRLQVEYRVLRPEEGTEIGERVAEQVRAGTVKNLPLAVLLDGLIAACVGFYTEREVDGEKVILPLNETLREPTDKLIRWGDPRLRAIFAPKLRKIYEVEDVGSLTVRQVVSGVIGDERLVDAHAREVDRWADRELEAVHSDF